MPTQPESDLAPEIAHVLLMDVVGYSKLLVDDQIVLLRQLNRIVRSTPHFVAAERKGQLKRLPTGDGMALLFFDSPETPVRCALEISAEVRKSAEIQLRMGVHSGAVTEVMDVNDRQNAAGAGIDMAQRVLDCGDAGHILLSQRVADDLKPYRHWNTCLQDLGECEVKHGLRLRLFNLCKDGLGNPALPGKLREQQGNLPKNSVSKKRWFAGAACLLLALVAAGLWYLTRSNSSNSPIISDKSIAVLPFTNLSDDKQNAYFAEGIQDEILTYLARIADLKKVISHTSVMQYGDSTGRNLPAIGKTLGVAYILEGSVQRAGNRVRITAQLIDARNDTHVWGEHYDRELSDVFAIQSEVAKEVALQLRVRLSPQEKAAIEERPTDDLEAYSFYVRGKAALASTTFNASSGEVFLSAARLFDQAIARDPNFFLAYYQLARTHDQIYLFGIDRNANRLALADTAVKAMQRLHPDAGETHVALGEHLYWGYRDYVNARTQFNLARRDLPNDPRPILLTAYLDRREGHSEAALRGFQRALELDPRDLNILQQISLSYQWLRRFPELTATLDRALSIAPNNFPTQVQRASVELDWRGDIRPLQAIIRSIVEKDPGAATEIADDWLRLALCSRDPAEAERAVSMMTPSGCRAESVLYPHNWCVGLAALAKGDTTAAHAAFTVARAEAENIVREQPAYGEGLSALALIDAALGHKEEAIAEGKRSLELLPLSEDAINGAILIENLALIYAWVGEKDLAFEQLKHATQIPSMVTYGQLRLHPNWDALRDDPRFAGIVDSLAPRE